MMKVGARFALAVVIGLSVPASAGLVTLAEMSLDELLTTPQAIGTVETTPMHDGSLKTTVHSQAYTNGSGLYAYLYQVDNAVDTGVAIAEQFTVAPFVGADENSMVGYLEGAAPTGFMTAPGQIPEPTGSVNIPSGPVVSFYYNDRFGAAIDVGEHSAVMYVISELPPGQITGNVIDGDVASGPVIGPIPEPSTVALLGLGSLVCLWRKR